MAKTIDSDSSAAPEAAAPVDAAIVEVLAMQAYVFRTQVDDVLGARTLHGNGPNFTIADAGGEDLEDSE